LPYFHPPKPPLPPPDRTHNIRHRTLQTLDKIRNSSNRKIYFQKCCRYQNKVLKCIVNAPWYVRNSDFHRDLGIETVKDIIAKFAKSHEKRLQDHINIEVSRLLTNKQTPWPLVRERTIPTERPPLVDEIECQLLQVEGCRVVSAADPLRSLISVF
jgi:uncharacterized protein YeeX (DUF496 family)